MSVRTIKGRVYSNTASAAVQIIKRMLNNNSDGHLDGHECIDLQLVQKYLESLQDHPKKPRDKDKYKGFKYDYNFNRTKEGRWRVLLNDDNVRGAPIYIYSPTLKLLKTRINVYLKRQEGRGRPYHSYLGAETLSMWQNDAKNLEFVITKIHETNTHQAVFENVLRGQFDEENQTGYLYGY